MASVLTPSNKKGISDLKDEVVEKGITDKELLQSIDAKLTEIVLHLRTITNEDFSC
jgi:hypothetical protein